MLTLPLVALFRRMAELSAFLPPFFPPEIYSFWGTSIAITPSGTPEVLPTPVGRKYSTGSSLLTSSPSMTLTYPLFSIASLTVAPPLTSALLPSLFHFLAHGRCFKIWVLITLNSFICSPLSGFCPNERPPSFNFQKACCGDFDFHCPSVEEYSSLSYAAAAATLFSSLALNAAKSYIAFGRIKRPPKAW